MSQEVEHKEKRSKLGTQRGKRKTDKYKTNRCLRKGIRRNYQSPLSIKGVKGKILKASREEKIRVMQEKKFFLDPLGILAGFN